MMIEDVTNRVKIVGFAFANVQAKNQTGNSEEILLTGSRGYQ
jgi:hypothetical protein